MGVSLDVVSGSPHVWQASAAVALLYLLYHISILVYDAYFGPLSKFPGPKLAAITKLPMMSMIWSGKIPTTTQDLHARYGSSVRVSPKEISYNCPQAWKDIYGHRFGGKQSFIKDPEHYGNGKSSIIDVDDADHSRMRRILSHSFSDKALKEQEPLLQRWADLLVEKLRQHAEGEKAVDMVSYYNFTTFDIMADLTFAEPLYMLEGSEYSPWVKTIFASIKVASRFRVLMKLPVLGSIINALIGKVAKQKQIEHSKYTDERVDRRLAKEPDRPDLWSHILKRKDETEGGLSLSEMHANASIFMIAGTETTATLLSGLTYFLLTRPEKLQKLLEELKEAFLNGEDLTVESLARCKYLNAVIEEGLRMYPPVPTGLPRLVPAGGAPICGEWVPGGTVVSVHNYASNHSPENFHLPDEFIPERWLSDAPAEFANDNKGALNPFSFGPRNCIGRNLAYHETRLLLTKVFWNFDLDLVDKNCKWNEQRVFFLWDKPELTVRLTPVKRL